MAENKMAEVAKLLGVRMNKDFEVVGTQRKFKLSKHGVYEKICDDHYQECTGGFINNLLTGEYEVVIKPFAPKRDERYWSYFGNKFNVDFVTWYGTSADYAFLKCGMVFRTEAEAVAARPRVYKELTGKEWRGDDE